mgnify:CR=1 FL=1
MSYTPPNKHNVYLNLEQIRTPQSRFNLVLNFGASVPSLNQLNTVIDTRVSAQISGTNTEIFINHGQLSAQIDTRINTQVSGLNWEDADNQGQVIAVINTAIKATMSGINDINHLLGVSHGVNTRYLRAITALSYRNTMVQANIKSLK